jgi:heme/copper-type cytochrome/quinol oxidase subunit 3
MSSADRTSADVFAETPEVHERNLRIGVHVIGGSTIMFFFALAFAYFYLRSVDSHGRWNAGDVAAPDAYGVAITALFVLGAAALVVAARAARRRGRWLAPAGIALVAAIAAVVVQAIEYANLGFGPHEGGYTSVFYGWTACLAVFTLGAAYWMTVLVAEGARLRTAGAQPAPAGLDEASLYVSLLAIIAVVAWVCLYLL